MHMRKIVLGLLVLLITSTCSSCDILNLLIGDDFNTNNKNKSAIVYNITPQNDTNTVTTITSSLSTSKTIKTTTTTELTTSVSTLSTSVVTEKQSEVVTTTVFKETSESKEEAGENCNNQQSEIQTVETITTQVEPIQTEEPTENEAVLEKMPDCIIWKDEVIEVTRAPGNQENVDQYDVVQDNKLISTSKDIYMFGHVYYSFFYLSYVEVGDKIILVNDGVKTDYTVIRNEIGLLTENLTDVISLEDDFSLIKGDFNCETLRMMTCVSGLSTEYRRIVICRKD